MHVSSNHHLQQPVTICYYARTDFSLIIPKMAAADTSGHTLSGSFNNAPFIIAHNGQCKSYYRIRTVAVASKGKVMEWRVLGGTVDRGRWRFSCRLVIFRREPLSTIGGIITTIMMYNVAWHESADGFFGFRKIK